MSGDTTIVKTATPKKHAAASAMVRTARRMVLLLVVLGIAWLGGLIWFANSIPSETGPGGGVTIDLTATDAVVVLTGGPLRLRAGLDLLGQGKAKKLFVSGVSRNVELPEILKAVQRSAAEPLSCCIAIGHDAADTAGNAAETEVWMQHEGFKSLRLVTASYHMPRSLLEFRRAMPEVTIVPYPVFPGGFKRETWWAWPGTLALIVSEYQKYVATAARYWLAMEAHKADARYGAPAPAVAAKP